MLMRLRFSGEFNLCWFITGTVYKGREEMDEWLEVNFIKNKGKPSEGKNICLMPSQMWIITILQHGFEEPEVCISFKSLWLSILPVGCFRTGYGLCWLLLNISNILSQQSFPLFVWISHFPGNWIYCPGHAGSRWMVKAVYILANW